MKHVTLTRLQTSGGELAEINWRIFPGDFWVVAGSFGSGKSDLLATAAGLQRPARGTVKIFGEETFTVREEILVEQRRKIGLVFSDGGRLFSRLTIAENIALPLRYHENLREEEAADAVGEILRATELIPFAEETPARIHPHWQQRAALARALLLGPEILLLDKPVAGMDFRHQRWWIDFLTQLSEGAGARGGKKMTLAIAADHLAIWKPVAKQFAVLSENRWHEAEDRERLDTLPPEALREFLTEKI